MFDIIFWVASAVMIIVVSNAVLHDTAVQWKIEDAEDEAFESNRQIRQQEFDRHHKEVNRYCLIEQWKSIHLGRINYAEKN